MPKFCLRRALQRVRLRQSETECPPSTLGLNVQNSTLIVSSLECTNVDFLSSTVPFFDQATCVTFKQSAAEISSQHIFEKFISTESLKLCSHNR